MIKLRWKQIMTNDYIILFIIKNIFLKKNYLKRINLNKSHNQKANTNTVTNALGHDYKRKETDKDV